MIVSNAFSNVMNVETGYGATKNVQICAQAKDNIESTATAKAMTGQNS